MVVRRVMDALVRGRAATLQSIWGDPFANLNPHVALWACATHTAAVRLLHLHSFGMWAAQLNSNWGSPYYPDRLVR